MATQTDPSHFAESKVCFIFYFSRRARAASNIALMRSYSFGNYHLKIIDLMIVILRIMFTRLIANISRSNATILMNGMAKRWQRLKKLTRFWTRLATEELFGFACV